MAQSTRKTCSIDGCDRDLYARDLCTPHYARKLRTGDPGSADVGRNTKGMTAWERFDHYVDTSGGPRACHPWTGPHHPQGYGVLRVSGKRIGAHRWLLGQELGRPLIPGEEAMHTCDNPACCNVRHLVLGTHADNMEDKRVKGRGVSPLAAANAAKTHCKHGHELAGANLYVDTAGKRQCRTCNARRQREFHARKRQQAAS